VVSRSVQSVLHSPAHLIYQGVPLPTLDPHIPKQFDVAILGRIHPVKQHMLFLHACDLLYQKRGNLGVLLISSHPSPSPYQGQVDDEISRLKSVGLKIHLTGELPSHQVYPWLAKAKILLVTSETEGYGRMAAEALACEVPVVANPVGGLLEILEDGQTGLFAQRDDAESFAELANRLLEDDVLRHEMGHRGRSLVETRFSYEAMLDAYEALYREIAK
jgi:glycosyltransferase involved in cell wall biosynthesis